MISMIWLVFCWPRDSSLSKLFNCLIETGFGKTLPKESNEKELKTINGLVSTSFEIRMLNGQIQTWISWDLIVCNRFQNWKKTSWMMNIEEASFRLMNLTVIISKRFVICLILSQLIISKIAFWFLNQLKSQLNHSYIYWKVLPFYFTKF